MKKVIGKEDEADTVPSAPVTSLGRGASAVARAPTPKRTPIQNRIGLRPKRSARLPATMAPQIVPMVAMATIMPSPKEDRAYSSVSFSSAPEMTAVSKPKSRPPREATMALRMTRGGMDVFCADDFVVMLAPHCGDGARVAPRTLAVLRCEPKKLIGQTIRTKGAIPAKALTETHSSQEACKRETQHTIVLV